MTRLSATAVCEVCEKEFRIWNKNDSSRFCSQACYHVTKKGKSSGVKGYVKTPALKLRKIDAAWLAGVFDGEGTIINAGKSRGYFTPRLCVGMCNEEIIRRIQVLTGCGSIQLRRGKKANHNDCYVWVCNGANAISILKQMQPWLIVKRGKAAEMIEQFGTGQRKTYTFTLDPS